MNDTATSERPVAITIICVLGFIGAALTIPAIFMSAASGIGAWYPPYLAFSAVVGVIVYAVFSRRWKVPTQTSSAQ